MTHEAPILEICCQDLTSVRTALDAGAHRIELCTALDCGGLTPSAGLISAAVSCATQFCRPSQGCAPPVMVLVRPRAGGFVYSRDEVQVMCADVRAARAQGASGVVFGCLRFVDGFHAEVEKGGVSETGRQRALEVDTEAMATLLGVVAEAKWRLGVQIETRRRAAEEEAEEAGEGEVTFHRAFDDTDDPLQAVDDIASLNAASGGLIKRILTSGQCASAEQGIACLWRVHERAKQTQSGIAVMPGAGITRDNVRKVAEQTGCWEVHASAKIVHANAQDESRLFGVQYTASTDGDAVKGILAALAIDSFNQ